MKLKIFIPLLVLIIVAALNGCRYDKSELVYPRVITGCDTAAVSYSRDIVGILTAHCYICHGGAAIDGSGIKLDTYAGISSQAQFGALLQVVEHVPGFSFMPKNGNKLSSCNIAIIRTWIRNGAPNN